MKRTTCKMAAAVLLGLLAGPSAWAEVPETFQKLWNDPEVVRRIDQNIERYRKADAAFEVVDASRAPIAGAKVTVVQKTHEFLFGCNLFVLGQLDTPEDNREYESAFLRLFNFATLPFYWKDLEPVKGEVRFEEGSRRIWRRPPPDRLVAWGKKHGLTLKGHALVYAKRMFMPDWTHDKQAQEVDELFRQHIQRLAKRYGDSITVWDVYNEELSRLALPPEAWLSVPDGFLANCFRRAAEEFPPQTVLMINEGGPFRSPSRYRLYLNEIDNLLKEEGVRCNGIGLQFHIGIGAFKSMLAGQSYRPKDYLEMYDAFCRFGIPLHITEVTVSTPPELPNSAVIQAEVTRHLYRMWFSVPQMAGITWWNLSDGATHVTQEHLRGGLLDTNLDPKPSYRALDRLINHDWKTRTAGETDANGRFTFRGFKGRYRVTVRTSGGTRQFQIDVGRGNGPHKLVFVETKD